MGIFCHRHHSGGSLCLLFAAIRLGDAIGLTVLGTALGPAAGHYRGTAAVGLLDREGVKSLALLPLRDLLGLASWVQVYTQTHRRLARPGIHPDPGWTTAAICRENQSHPYRIIGNAILCEEG